MKKILEVTLGIVTSIGGFLEVGSIATSAQVGALYGFRLGWAIVLGTIVLVFLIEMSGRLAAVSGHTVADAMRERFGIDFFVVPLVTLLIVVYLVLASELGGVCLALQYATGVRFQWWAIPVALVAWLVMWFGTFGIIEKGVSLLGLVTIAFVVANAKMDTPWHEVLRGFLPSLPDHDPPKYWFLVVSILGATIAPYLFFFYSSGAVEDKWRKDHLSINRVVAVLGMGFGGGLSIAVLTLAAMVFNPRGIDITSYDQVAMSLMPALGHRGFQLFILSLGIACFGAVLEITLSVAYMVAQGLGWNWGENLKPAQDARFSLVYTGFVLLAALPILIGLDPLRITNLSMALTAATLPLGVIPFLVLMNDRNYVAEHRNGWLSNAVVLVTIVMACVLAVVTIPLELVGG